MKLFIAFVLFFALETSAITITTFPDYGCFGNGTDVIFNGPARTCTAGRVNGASTPNPPPEGYIFAYCVLETGTDADRTLYTRVYDNPKCEGEPILQKDFDLSTEFCSNQDNYGYRVDCSANGNVPFGLLLFFIVLFLNKF